MRWDQRTFIEGAEEEVKHASVPYYLSLAVAAVSLVFSVVAYSFSDNDMALIYLGSACLALVSALDAKPQLDAAKASRDKIRSKVESWVTEDQTNVSG